MSTTPTPTEWDARYREGNTPWDLGSHSPLVQRLANARLGTSVDILVPGCGLAHDVEALAARAESDPAVADALPDRVVGSLAELVGLAYDPDEICASVHDDPESDVLVSEDDALRAFPVADGYVPEDFPYAEDDDDDFDVTSYAD